MENFGISFLLTETPERYSVKSISVSHLLFLERNDMIETLKEFPEDLVNFFNFLFFFFFFFFKIKNKLKFNFIKIKE